MAHVDPQDARDAIESAWLYWLSQPENRVYVTDAVERAVTAWFDQHPERVTDALEVLYQGVTKPQRPKPTMSERPWPRCRECGEPMVGKTARTTYYHADCKQVAEARRKQRRPGRRLDEGDAE